MATEGKAAAAKQVPAPADGGKLRAAGPGQRPANAVRDQSSAATGASIFDRADAGNRRLGRRNRS